MENLNLAFDVAEKYLDIPRMLDPEGKRSIFFHNNKKDSKKRNNNGGKNVSKTNKKKNFLDQLFVIWFILTISRTVGIEIIIDGRVFDLSDCFHRYVFGRFLSSTTEK